MRRTLAILFTLAPFVAGMVAVLSVRRDWRMLCMAAAATAVVRAVAVATSPGRERVSVGVGFALATATAAAIAVAFGARAAPGILAVAVVLAGCAAGGAMLDRRSQG